MPHHEIKLTQNNPQRNFIGKYSAILNICVTLKQENKKYLKINWV